MGASAALERVATGRKPLATAVGLTTTVELSASAPGGCTQIWGVLNVTPDSFSDGGRFLEAQRAIEHGRRMLAQGAHVIDVGGASSRPRGQLYGEGAAAVDAGEERARVVPVVRALVQELGATVSIDTTSAEVAAAALDAGARIVNDVSCGRSDALVDLVAERGADYVLMHTRGAGEVVPDNTCYGDVVLEVRDELMAAVARAGERGVVPERVWLDPGIGFAKTSAQSLALLAGTARLVETGHRVLVGPSRKGFIAETAALPDGERPGPDAREAGTAAAVTAAVLHGADAVRVHDVAGMRQAALVAAGMRAAGGRA